MKIVRYRYVLVCLVSFGCFLFAWWWTAFPLLLIQFTHDFVRIGTPPSPNELMSARYSLLDYFPILVVTLGNYLPIVMLPLAVLMRRQVPEIGDAIRWFIGLVGITTIVCLILLLITWGFFCNGAGSGRYSACNDYRWCGRYFPSPWCPNTNIFFPVDVSMEAMSRNDEFFSIIWGCLIYLMLLYFTYKITKEALPKYKILI